MERWTCPKCQRQFGRPNQGHTCSPGLSLEEYFATAKPWERPIFERVSVHVGSLGDVIVDPLAMGIMFKNGPMMCELRAMKKWTAVGFFLRRRLTSGRLSRKVVDYNGKFFHVVNVSDPDQIDDEVLTWLTEAFHIAGGNLEAAAAVAAGGGGEEDAEGGYCAMVPDDVDDPFA